MTERVYTTIDKSGWGDGEWLDEPDKVQWVDEATGLPCLVVRQPRLGNWCGYVGVSEGHPAFEQDYGDVLVPDEDGDDGWPDVHGGLTYSAHCQEGNDESRGICHVPEPGQPDHVWWLGFDCAHSGDLSPYMAQEYGWTGETYRTLSYVRSQCRKLAAQLAAAGAASAR